MVNTLLNKAIDELQYLNPGEVFLVKDLFKGYIWNRIDRNVRLRLGILFLNYINSTQNVGVVALEKTSSNQQKYKKI